VHYLDKLLQLSLGATPLNLGVQVLMAERVRFRTPVDKGIAPLPRYNRSYNDFHDHSFQQGHIATSQPVALFHGEVRGASCPAS